MAGSFGTNQSIISTKNKDNCNEKDIARRKVKMSGQVSQIIDDKEGTVTVVSTDDHGRQYASTESYYTSSSSS